MAEVVPTGAGNPKQQNVGDSRSLHFGDGVDRSHQSFQNPHPDSEIPASLRSPVEATRAGLEAARNFNANNQNSWSDNSQGSSYGAPSNDQVLGKGKPNPPSGQLSSDNGS